MKIFKKGNVLYDLGSGHGNLLISFVKHNDIRGVGIEKDPIKYFLSKLNIKLNKLDNRINIIHGDIFTTNLKDADVVYCYLLQKTNEKLRKKLESELKKGTRIISHYFSFPDWKEIVYDKKSHTYLYVSGKSYKMKK